MMPPKVPLYWVGVKGFGQFAKTPELLLTLSNVDNVNVNSPRRGVRAFQNWIDSH